MKLYVKEIRPFMYVPACQGWSDTWEPLEDWQPEENEELLKTKYGEDYKFKDSWGSLKLKTRYVEYSTI